MAAIGLALSTAALKKNRSIKTPIHTFSLPLVKLDYVFSVNSQPYFINRDVPESILNLGNFLNQTTPNILIFEFVFLQV